MRLPVCTFDIESDMLCPNCQARLDRGEITEFDIEFSKWLLEREKEFRLLENLNLQRAIKLDGRIILIVKKNSREILDVQEDLMSDIKDSYGETFIIEGPPKLRRIVRSFIQPAIEVGVNSLYLPDGSKESIVMLREEDRNRISYTSDELRTIVSAIMSESVFFEFQDDRQRPPKEKEEDKEDIFDQKMRDLGGPHRT